MPSGAVGVFRGEESGELCGSCMYESQMCIVSLIPTKKNISFDTRNLIVKRRFSAVFVKNGLDERGRRQLQPEFQSRS
jgi:hypothetical protein